MDHDTVVLDVPCKGRERVHKVAPNTSFCYECGLIIPRPDRQNARRAAAPGEIPLSNHRQKVAAILKLIDRDGPECFFCEVELLHPVDFGEADLDDHDRYPTLDHVIPRSLGGRDQLENLVLACKRCNGRKRNELTMVLELVRRLRKQLRGTRARLDRAEKKIEHMKREAAIEAEVCCEIPPPSEGLGDGFVQNYLHSMGH